VIDGIFSSQEPDKILPDAPTHLMKPIYRTTILYGMAIAALVAIMKFIEYRYIVHDLTLEFYLGLIALLFTGLGIWAGFRLTRTKPKVIIQHDFVFDSETFEKIGISKRELEVLQLMSQGFSNQEIADKLFVSLNTVKTHSSNLFLKLDVSRRTQAVQRGKELRLIP
jgi:two-component system, NarL family, response regulator LiaR